MGVATAAVVEGAETAFAQAASDTIHPTADQLERNGSRALRSRARVSVGEDGASLLEHEARVRAQSRGASDRISPRILAVARPPAPDP
jgi:hypothetical protein